jgi:hypothetical protein
VGSEGRPGMPAFVREGDVDEAFAQAVRPVGCCRRLLPVKAQRRAADSPPPRLARAAQLGRGTKRVGVSLARPKRSSVSDAPNLINRAAVPCGSASGRRSAG